MRFHIFIKRRFFQWKDDEFSLENEDLSLEIYDLSAEKVLICETGLAGRVWKITKSGMVEMQVRCHCNFKMNLC